MQRILIVEDSPTMRAMLASALEELPEPVKLTAVSSGFEALRELPRTSYDRSAVEFLGDVQERTRANEDSSGQLEEMTRSLLDQAETLREDVRRFRIG